jgi:hypothetical protein
LANRGTTNRSRHTSLGGSTLAALRLPASVGRHSGSPCGSLPRCGLLFCASCGRRHVCPLTCRASETGHRLSATPESVEERRGPPRLRDRPLRACYGRTPRRILPPPGPNLRRGLLLPSMNSSTLGIREDIGFGAAVPRPARSHTYASPNLFPRTAQGLLPARAGSPLAGQDSHLLDDVRSFMVASHPPIPFVPQGLVALKRLFSGLPLYLGRLECRREGRGHGLLRCRKAPDPRRECKKAPEDLELTSIRQYNHGWLYCGTRLIG